MKISKESSGINLVDSENSIYYLNFQGCFTVQLSRFFAVAFCVSDKYYIKSLLLCQDFFKTFFVLLFCLYRVSKIYIIRRRHFCQHFFSFFLIFFNICSNPRKFDIFRDFRAVLTDSPIVIRLPSIAKGYPAGGFQPDIPSLHWVLL